MTLLTITFARLLPFCCCASLLASAAAFSTSAAATLGSSIAAVESIGARANRRVEPEEEEEEEAVDCRVEREGGRLDCGLLPLLLPPFGAAAGVKVLPPS